MERGVHLLPFFIPKLLIMISTKQLVDGPKDVPSYWIFEFYCNLSERLTGQDIKIKSLFKPDERTPSFCIYVRDNVYRFKDFSTGMGGSAIDLVQYLFNFTLNQAAQKVICDYNEYVLTGKLNNDLREFKKQAKYQVRDYTKRGWTKQDADFWTQFRIDSDTLNNYNVIPLESYSMVKEDNSDKIVITGPNLYGYTRIDGTIYKVYQPKVTEHKFFKVKNYIQGTDQLKFNVPNLVICSSLKDAMCLTKFGYNTEVVAPDSENSLIPNGAMSMYKIKYKAICTLFDNDEAGIKAAEKYQEQYDIPGVILPMSKDLSDSVRDYGIPETRKVLHPLLKEALKK
jgi:DNA primase